MRSIFEIGTLGDEIPRAIDEAITTEFENVQSVVSDIDSDSTLKDHIKTLRKLAVFMHRLAI